MRKEGRAISGADPATRQALADLGAHDDLIGAADRAALDRDGFLVLTGVLGPDEVVRFRRRLDELVATEGDAAGTEITREAGTARLANLIDKDPVFDVCVGHPRVLAAVAYVLGHDLKLSGLNCRIALPGSGGQELHVDWGEPVPAGGYRACNTLWCVDAFTADNGATLVVPGSHLLERMPPAAVPAAMSRQPVAAPAGSVIVLNAHLWHCGTVNRTSRPRRALHSYFVRRAEPPQQQQRDMVRPDAQRRLSPPLRHLLDLPATPP